MCQKVSEGMKRCLDNCLGVSGDVYRHPRVPIGVNVCQNVSGGIKRCLEQFLEVSGGAYRHPRGQ